MANLTRATFLDALDGLWGSTQANFAKVGVAHGHMVALDSKANGLYFMQAPDGVPEAVERGIVPVPGPWIDHLELIKEKFVAHKAVAAILIGEAWVGQGPVGLETIRMNIAPHEHPMSDEIVFVLGAWPREFVTTAYTAVIMRDDQGKNPQLADHEQIGGRPLELLSTWLNDLLPQPHH